MKIKKYLQNKKTVLGLSIIALFIVGVCKYDNLNFTSDLFGAHKNTRNIVVFSENLGNTVKNEIIRKSKGVKVKDLDLINGVVIEGVDVQGLLELPGVERVDEDIILEIVASNNIKEGKGDAITWAISMVNADKVERNIHGDRTKIGILDTGIDLTHPDLYDNIKGNYNAINNLVTGNDDNGHGSHIAGIIGAVQNQMGIVGMYPKAKLYAIKAFNSGGNAYLSDVIAGIDWAINNDIEVLNMSFGTTSNIPSLHTALKIAYNKGIVLVGAVGNTRSSVLYPARYDEVIAVSGVGSNEERAWFSNIGPQVDLSAPGVSVYSTINNQDYSYKTGTSMASAFVSGAAAILLNKPVGQFDVNGNGKWDPLEVKNKLTQTARDKGTPGVDNYYGHGIVDIYSAMNY